MLRRIADSLLCCVTSELKGAYAYGLAGTMVWEIWPVFGNDGGYECASVLSLIAALSTSQPTIGKSQSWCRKTPSCWALSDPPAVCHSFNYSQSGSKAITSMLKYQAARVRFCLLTSAAGACQACDAFLNHFCDLLRGSCMTAVACMTYCHKAHRGFRAAWQWPNPQPIHSHGCDCRRRARRRRQRQPAPARTSCQTPAPTAAHSRCGLNQPAGESLLPRDRYDPIPCWPLM